MNRDFYKEQLEIHIPRAKKRTILKNKIKCKSLKLLINEILENISSLSKKKKFIYSLKSKLIDWSFTLPTINDMTIGDNPYSQINYDNRQKDVKKAKEYISKLKSIYDKYVFECLPTDYIDGLNKFSEFIEGINCLQTRAVKREYIESRKKKSLMIFYRLL
ncbi:hypothetical protein [Francisella hispaniensis]|uniref:Uncharacterized protein n=1 Tax=Francisella hispaniensis FSC454 TaxID=1088883 RepID=A0AAC9J5M3_9GAMM|nr:hypothetical protein [Francisella hispaniensis]APD50874.1 hypothetical protein FSC454_07035 [Francisella hispaniensis FSC454]